MTEIEKKALALVNEAQKIRGLTGSPWNSPTILNEALYRAIEQHEAFRQEVSDAVKAYKADNPFTYNAFLLERFIIAKADPLVEALEEASGTNDPVEWANRFYAAIEKRGGKITWGEARHD